MEHQQHPTVGNAIATKDGQGNGAISAVEAPPAEQGGVGALGGTETASGEAGSHLMVPPGLRAHCAAGALQSGASCRGFQRAGDATLLQPRRVGCVERACRVWNRS